VIRGTPPIRCRPTRPGRNPADEPRRRAADVVTWADREYLAAFADDIAALRRDADIVVASCHWGLGQEVLDYMTEIAHAAVDAGADIVIGHGPHYSLPVEIYHGKPIFYGLGSFSFHTAMAAAGTAIGSACWRNARSRATALPRRASASCATMHRTKPCSARSPMRARPWIASSTAAAGSARVSLPQMTGCGSGYSI
jgi:hypothetical protein